MALEKELETYRAKLGELMAHEGQYVVIHGDDVIATLDSYEDALKQGYEKCRLEPFLVKKISAVEPVNFFTRAIVSPCPTSPSH